MPTYEYACKSCGEQLEVVQSFRDDPLTTCPKCEGPLRKVFGNIGIAFKGSGFYKTDSRSSSGDGKPAKAKEPGSSSDGGSSASKSSPSSSSSSDKAGSGSGTKAAAS